MLLSFAYFYIGCSKGEEPGNENNPENPTESEIPEEFKDSYLNTTIQIDGANTADFYKGCYVNSIFDEVSVSNGTMKLQSNINKKVQTYFLTDGGDKIYQMTRVSDTEKNKKIDFSAESTAMAFVTFHPLFASIDSVAYDVLTEVILQSENFPKVRTEINNLIKQKKDLYSEDNASLFDALDSLLNELIVFANYKPAEETTSRTITNETMYYPFKINSSGRRLDFQVFGLNPNYYGTATHADGSVENLVVESHEDFGLLAFLESGWNYLNNKGWNANQYGNVESYSFPSEGECKFHFSCKTEENQADLINRCFKSMCEIAGIDIETPINLADYIAIINEEVVNSSYKLGTPYFPFYSVAGQLGAQALLDAAKILINKGIEQSFKITIDYYEKEKMTYDGQKIQEVYENRLKALKEAQALFKKAMKFYTLTKEIANIAVRLIAAQKASDPIDFKFCYYDNNVHFCSQLWKVKGDNQTGIYGEKLSEPISVALNVDMGNHSAYVLKFEVCKGGGTVGESGNKEEYVELGDFDNIVSTMWRMGSDSKKQMVRVSLCEKATKEVVCEPVEFMATAVDKYGIYIVDGNNQIGKPNKALPRKLRVGLTSSELFDTSEFRVQFEVVEGSGSVTPQYAELSGGITECTWFLGNQNEKQKVKAVLVSSLTYKEASEPIYFDASFEDKTGTGIIGFKQNTSSFNSDYVMFDATIHAAIETSKEIQEWGIYIYNFNDNGGYAHYPSMQQANKSEDFINIYTSLPKNEFDHIDYIGYLASEDIQIGIYEIDKSTGQFYYYEPEKHKLIYDHKPMLSFVKANILKTENPESEGVQKFITSYEFSYNVNGSFWFDNLNCGIPSSVRDEIGLIEVENGDGDYSKKFMFQYSYNPNKEFFLYLIGNLSNGGEFVSHNMIKFTGMPIKDCSITKNTHKANSQTRGIKEEVYDSVIRK